MVENGFESYFRWEISCTAFIRWTGKYQIDYDLCLIYKLLVKDIASVCNQLLLYPWITKGTKFFI